MEMRDGDSASLTALAASTKTAARSIVGFNGQRTKRARAVSSRSEPQSSFEPHIPGGAHWHTRSAHHLMSPPGRRRRTRAVDVPHEVIVAGCHLTPKVGFGAFTG